MTKTFDDWWATIAPRYAMLTPERYEMAKELAMTAYEAGYGDGWDTAIEAYGVQYGPN